MSLARLAARAALCVASTAALLLALPDARAAALPPEVVQALRQAQVPRSALSVVIRELDGGRTLLSLQPQRPVNPASLTKLLTTMAALDRLGPAWTWSTPVWLDGRLHDGVLDGPLVIQGSGDPQLVIERLWLLLRRVQEAGVRELRGGIVLDDSAFAPPAVDPAEFDGEPTRPYNVQPDALLLNHKAVIYSFVPDPAAGVAQVLAEPALAGAVVDRSVALVDGPCNDWRAALKADFGGPVHFAGRYAAACGEQAWAVADPQPDTYDARLLQALWAGMGGRLDGGVRAGAAPSTPPSFVLHSPPLAEIVRDINKYSNNVMAQQLFYTLDLVRHPQTPATLDGAREALRGWLADTLGALPPELVIDNGSGLSRRTRISSQLLARLLARAYDSSTMPELMASLPIAGVDGTLRRMQVAPGRAHLKSGSLRDVAALAGYVLSDSGRRYVLVAMVEHPDANAARPALDALVRWTLHDGRSGNNR